MDRLPPSCCPAPTAGERRSSIRAHTRGAPARTGLRPVGRGRLHALPSAAPHRAIGQAAYRPKRPRTWGSCTGRASPSGSGYTPSLPLLRTGRRPSRAEAEAPTRVGLLLGPGLTRRGERRAPPHPSRARARLRQEVNLPRTRRGGDRSTVPDTFSDPTPTSLAVAGMLQRRVCTFALTTDVALRNAGGERSLNQ